MTKHYSFDFQYLNLIFLLWFFVFCSCEKENDISTIEKFDKGVFVLNEGNFQWENSSVSFYSKNSKEVSNHIFYNRNLKKLGDVAQSMSIYDSLACIVINNSQKVEIVKINNFESVGTIIGFVSPRHIQVINNEKAYVTDLYSNSIQVVNLEQKQIASEINCNGWCEQMLFFQNELFVANIGGNQILKIDVYTNLIIDSLETSAAPNSIVIDKNEKIWVLCGNIYGKSGNAKLIRFNPTNMEIEKSFLFPETNSSPTNLNTNGVRDTLFFADGDIFRMSIYDDNLPKSNFISANKNNIYGLGLDPENSDIYFSDAKDYLQNGIIYRYSSSGSKLDSFAVGIIPQFFCFN
ncbi:MAG: hypothetical protein HN704_12995 [Bacteroidetes bacterium]|jgi:hypothetical protein|nr:hypothetical protein [Bacteroidota bacterium]MBT6686783.1 hypothetical protein [Bacteroidota bacterium]MBT7141978.1 hypothetical protein [Bacteroidota bacterium]MBT7492512.1 hypothetical protein [Bacteroidota bacterium]